MEHKDGLIVLASRLGTSMALRYLHLTFALLVEPARYLRGSHKRARPLQYRIAL